MSPVQGHIEEWNSILTPETDLETRYMTDVSLQIVRENMAY